MSDAQIKLDLACALVAARRLSRSVAARIAGINLQAMDEELYQRKIPFFTEEMLEQDLATLASFPGK